MGQGRRGRKRIATMEVLISEIGADGLGVARTGALEIRARRGLPGDRVRVHVEHRSPHRPQVFGVVTEIVEPAPERRESPCAHADACGGCALIELSEPAQRAAKLTLLRGALTPAVPPRLLPSTISFAPPALHYRRRAKYVVRGRPDTPRLGAYARHSHRFVGTQWCPVVTVAIQEAIPHITAALAQAEVEIDAPGHAGLRYVQVRSNRGGETLITLVARSAGDPLSRAAISLGTGLPGCVGVTLDLNTSPGDAILAGHGEVLWGRGLMAEQLSGCDVDLDPYAFAQLHGPAGEALVQRVAHQLEEAPPGRILDLYAGVGAFGLAIAARRPVIAVERLGTAASAGARAARRAGRPLQWVCADCSDFLSALDGRDADLAAVVVDPPRRGLGQRLCEQLVALRPPRLVYVSCSPSSLARDLQLLVAGGLSVESIEAIDLFPQTPRVELVAVLTTAAKGAQPR